MNASEDIFRGIFVLAITGAVTGNIGCNWFDKAAVTELYTVCIASFQLSKNNRSTFATILQSIVAQITKNNIREFRQKLLDWFELSGREFPWRSSGLSEYELIIAEVLLQRTKAETISKFYHGFIKHFPNWSSLNNASNQDVEEFLKPVGLYRQRSTRIKKLAKEMVDRNGALLIILVKVSHRSVAK